jgi:tRNA-2-methylthio-N6-dimethylallyladenosine synthase
VKRTLHILSTPTDVPALRAPHLSAARGTTVRRVYVENYGCQMNLNDSEIIRAILADAGYLITERPDDADAILLNTCAVRDHAEERVFGRLGELFRRKAVRPGLVLGVCGCMAQHLGDAILHRAPYVDLVMGPDSYRNLPHALAQEAEEPFLDLRLDRAEQYLDIVPARKQHVTAWLTVQRGCDKFCTFCIVPFVRGRERSIPLPALVEQTRQLAAEGVREVTLLGQTVNSYRDGDRSFADLLQAVAEVDGIERVRFTSPHPSDATEPMIRVMATHPKVCKHIHLPLQSASNDVLRRMRRTYTYQQYRDIVFALRDAAPGVAISTDIIVGFPGETDEDFRATCDAVADVRYDNAFLFQYSPREGTVAYKKFPDDVPDEEKARRLNEVIRLQEGISRQRYRERIGRTVEVLVEGAAKRNADQFYGKTDDFKATVFPRVEGVALGDIVPVRIEDATAHTLIGQFAGESGNQRASG